MPWPDAGGTSPHFVPRAPSPPTFGRGIKQPSHLRHGSGPSRRVLVVDDETDVLHGLASALAYDGYDVTCADTLAQGIHLLRSESFDLVLTDLYLGNDDLGSRIAEIARSMRPAPPVVVLTGRPTFDGAQAALRSHVADIVVKPVDTQVLLSTCQRVVQEAALARRNRELESINEVLSSIIPRTIEIKDPTTSGHAARVVGYTDRLADRCGVSDEDRASLRLASLLHDIGKIGIPDKILQKPGPLTQDEREIINRHPQMGYEVLERLGGAQENVRMWVYQHHERWDGKGYPNRLAGEDVALPGRILVLAEVYDALAEKRSYKPSWPITKIVDFFRHEAGRQFDPDLAHIVADGLERMGPRYFAESQDRLF